jgi:hypothetical protein
MIFRLVLERLLELHFDITSTLDESHSDNYDEMNDFKRKSVYLNVFDYT